MNDEELDYVSPPPLSVTRYRYVPAAHFEAEKEASKALLEALRRVKNLLWCREAKAYAILDEAIKNYESR